MTYQVVRGDARRIPLADGSAHCCVTSPPYYGLRDYGCDGQLGLEKTPAEYVARMVEAFREVRRVLRDDGTCWINIGDSYAGSNQTGGLRSLERSPKRAARMFKAANPMPEGLKPKDLIGIPWRVAFALQADGWTLRSDIIWAKPNPMPESVTDRPTKAHEYLFLLSKSPTYYYDADAVRETFQTDPRENYPGRAKILGRGRLESSRAPIGAPRRDQSGGLPPNGDGRNLRTVWTIATKPYKGAHFAVMPPALVRPCILAGTSERGCCPTCGTPWRRVVEKGESDYQRLGSHNGKDFGRGDSQPGGAGLTRTANGTVPSLKAATSTTLGWEPSCPCPPHEPQPCTVLDPFGGAMTTLVVAEALGRRGVGVELSAKHCARGKRRLDRPHARPEPPADTDEPLPLFA